MSCDSQPLALDDVGGAFSRIEKGTRIIQPDVLAPRFLQCNRGSGYAASEINHARKRSRSRHWRRVRVGSNERVLDHVGGDVMIEHHPHGVTVERGLVAIDKLREQLDLAGQHALDHERIVSSLRIPESRVPNPGRMHHDTTSTAS